MLNMRRTAFGRALVAVREKDFAAAVIGVHSFRYKLMAFWSRRSSAGSAARSWRSASTERCRRNSSTSRSRSSSLAMVIVGGLGSVLGSFFGAALILLPPG